MDILIELSTDSGHVDIPLFDIISMQREVDFTEDLYFSGGEEEEGINEH